MINVVLMHISNAYYEYISEICQCLLFYAALIEGTPVSPDFLKVNDFPMAVVNRNPTLTSTSGSRMSPRLNNFHEKEGHLSTLAKRQ
jgi:hypothetical protein